MTFPQTSHKPRIIITITMSTTTDQLCLYIQELRAELKEKTNQLKQQLLVDSALPNDLLRCIEDTLPVVESRLLKEAKTRQIDMGTCVDSVSAKLHISFPRDVSILHENVICEIVRKILPDFQNWIEQKKVELFGSINSDKSKLNLFVEWGETIAIVLEWKNGESDSLFSEEDW